MWESLRWSKTIQMPPPLQRGPRRCSVRYLLVCPVGSCRIASGARSASDDSARGDRNVKVLDFIQFGGFDCPDHLPPAVLTPALKRTMVNLADCP